MAVECFDNFILFKVERIETVLAGALFITIYLNRTFPFGPVNVYSERCGDPVPLCCPGVDMVIFRSFLETIVSNFHPV